jgi:hypothetical protein
MIMNFKEIKQKRLATFGYTPSGSAIVDAVWFTSYTDYIGIVLILGEDQIWKAYIAAIPIPISEKNDAKLVAEKGAKVPFEIANAVFPGRFTAEDFDSI